MSTVHSFLLTIVSSLGDARPGGEFRRYPLRDLVAYYNEAMCFIAALRRDLFTKPMTLKLQPGIFQDAKCCGCMEVVGVMAQVDEDGNILKDLSEVSSVSAQTARWYRAPCRATEQGAVPLIQSIGFESGMAGVFSVHPPVPLGTPMWVQVKCVTRPYQITEADVLGGLNTEGNLVPPINMGWCTFTPAVRSYVMYRALGGDRHAVGGSAEAAREIKAVYDYLNVQYKMEQHLQKEAT